MAYQGTIAPILAGQGGFNGSENFDAIPYTDLLEATNIRFDGDAWRKVGGLAKLDANAVTSTPNCVAGIDYFADFTTQRQVTVWDNGKAYKEIGGDIDAVELATGLTVTGGPPTLLTCGQEAAGAVKKLLFLCQGQQPYYVNSDANTFSNLTAHAVDWSGTNYPSSAVMHDRRVYAYGNPGAPHAIYASAIDDHTNFLYFTAGDSASGYLPSFDINPGEGQEIRACHSIGSTRLYVFKYPVGIYFVDTSTITSYITPVTTVRTDIGIAGPKAITKAGSLGTFFIGADAHIYNLGLISNPDVDPREASVTAQLNLATWLSTYVNFARLEFSQLIWDSNRRELSAYYSTTSSSLNNLALVIDLRDPSRPRIATENRGMYFNAVWTRINTSKYPEITVAGTGGFVYRANQSTRSIGATGYQGRLRTADTDFSWMGPKYGAYTKRFDWLEFVYNAVSDGSAFVDTFIDGQFYNTYSLSLAIQGGQLGSFILGTSTLGAMGQFRTKLKIGGIGKRFGFRIRQSDAASDFSISRALIHFVPQETGGEKSN